MKKYIDAIGAFWEGIRDYFDKFLGFLSKNDADLFTEIKNAIDAILGGVKAADEKLEEDE